MIKIISTQSYENEESLNQPNFKERKQKQQARSQIQCVAIPMKHQLFKQPQEQSEFIVLGDLILEMNAMNDIDYMMKVSYFFQDKRCNHRIKFLKSERIIEVSTENKYRGDSNFALIYTRLIQCQNQEKYCLALDLKTYLDYMEQSEISYRIFVESIGFELLIEKQNIFINNKIQELVNSNEKDDCYMYTAVSYIDQQETGCPINIKFGISEGAAAIFGCSLEQLNQILQNSIYFAYVLSRDIVASQINAQQIMNMIINTKSQPEKHYFEYPCNMITLDGIYISYLTKVNTYIQREDGNIITVFYAIEITIDAKTIQQIISLRKTQSHYYNPHNILDLLISDNINSMTAHQFGKFISDHKNFQPPSLQDQFPNKTCKIRDISNNFEYDQYFIE